MSASMFGEWKMAYNNLDLKISFEEYLGNDKLKKQV